MPKWLVILVVCLAPVLYFARGPYGSWKERRACRHAAIYLDQTNLARASLCARQALQVNSNSVPACGIMAELAERAGSPNAVAWRLRLAELEPDRSSNQIQLARTSLEFGHKELCARALNAVVGGNTNQLMYQQTAARLAFSRAEVDRAQRHLLEAIRLAPTNPLDVINLEIVRLHSADAKVAADARNCLSARCGLRRSSASGPGDVGARTNTATDTPGAKMSSTVRASILRALLREAASRRNLADAEACSAELQTLPEVTFDDRLVHFGIAFERCRRGHHIAESSDADEDSGHVLTDAETTAAAAAERAQVWSRLNEEFRVLTNAATAIDPPSNASATVHARIGGLAHWLMAHGLADRALAWLETLPGPVQSEPSVQMAGAECRAASRQWADLASTLLSRHWGVQDDLRHAYLARAYREQGEDDLARIEWKRALKAREPRSWSLVRVAAAWNWERDAEELLWEMAREAPDERDALEMLRRASELNRDTASLLRVYELVHRRDPQDLVAGNNYAALCLLLRTDLNAAHALALETFRKNPEILSFASTYAFSLFLRGRAMEAAEILGSFPERELRRPVTALYYGLVLEATGRSSEARDFLATADAGPLLPEECAMLNRP